MKQFVAIMSWEPDNRIAKFQDFETQAEALNHIAAHLSNFPNAFEASKPNNDVVGSWLVDSVTKTLSIDFPVIVPPTDEERIDAAFPQTDVARVIFETFFEVANMIRELQDIVKGTAQGPINRAQLKTNLKKKLP